MHDTAIGISDGLTLQVSNAPTFIDTVLTGSAYDFSATSTCMTDARSDFYIIQHLLWTGLHAKSNILFKQHHILRDISAVNIFEHFS
jgi:hypothetical protein